MLCVSVVTSELQSRHDRSLPRRRRCETGRAGRSGVGITSAHGRGTDVSETASGEAGDPIDRLRGEGVICRRHIDPRAIEDVCEFGSYHQADSFAKPEPPSQAEALAGPALLPVIFVVGIRGAEFPLRRIAPCRWIQDESSSRIVAAAIDVQLLIRVSVALFVHPRRREERLAGHALDQRALKN